MTADEYRWDGPYFKGAMRHRREIKRAQAEFRNERTPRHRRRATHVELDDLFGDIVVPAQT